MSVNPKGGLTTLIKFVSSRHWTMKGLANQTWTVWEEKTSLQSSAESKAEQIQMLKLQSGQQQLWEVVFR